MQHVRFILHAAAMAAALLAAAAASADAPRTAVLTAFAPEYEAIRARMSDVEVVTERGAEYLTGTLGGRAVIVGQTGISMVNAAMNTQLLIDLHAPKSIVVSGIAGGVDPALKVGDVTVPAQWSQYLDSAFARKGADGEWHLPPFLSRDVPNYGMIFPQGIAVWRGDLGETKTYWFDADPAMLAAARSAAASVDLRRCGDDGNCLEAAPSLKIGGRGVSGSVFVDNADFRDYVQQTFQADALDMESAAVAMVAMANGTPFVAVRSLSDLAGGEPDMNAIGVFFAIAAENAARTVEALVRNLPPDR
ncbi:MAG: phosphorylase [Minwuia sp.]|uniref:5'-methylthioadenosine/S-adenosylhomocysteine nucleosidase family protein n=1 Tax=Minwuia sp. TaxID=2493630 RepID=UPI003A85DCBD